MTKKTSETGQEQRRHARRITAQTARIRFGSAPPIPCEIRDYCPSGLHVAFPGATRPDAAFPALLDTPVQVEFSVGNSAIFRLDGRVARVASGGLGIFIPAFTPGATEALSAANQAFSATSTEPAAGNLDPQEAQALRQACATALQGFLETVLPDFFQQAIERLAEVGQEEVTFLERSRFDYGAKELLQRRGQVEDAFFTGMRERVANLRPAQDQEVPVPRAGTLSLVGEAEFEDWLNLSAVVRQLEVDFAEQLHPFEQRYSRLVGMPIDRRNDPYGPEAIGLALQGAIQGSDFSGPVRLQLYQALGQALSGHADAFYARLNELLAALDPSPPVRARAPIPPAVNEKKPAVNEQMAAQTQRPELDLAEIAATLDKLHKQDGAAAPVAPDKAEYSLDRILAALNTSRQSPPARVTSPVSTSAQGPDVLQVLDRLRHVSRQLNGRDEPALPPGVTASLGDVLSALDKFPLDHAGVKGDKRAAPLSERLDARMLSQGTVRLAPDHRKVLDASADLLARAWADSVPGSDIATLMERLERPMLKLALQDPSFPNSPEHPARQVFNLIEQYAVAADDQGRFFDAKLQRFLYVLVDRVCTQADADPGIFEAVRDSLEKVLRPILQIRRTRVARLQEASEGRERIRVARARANAALEQRFAGREVPALLLRLLDAGWRQFLVLLEMREGERSEDWVAAFQALDTVLGWLDPAGRFSPRPAGAVQAVLNEIERGLVAVNVESGLLATFMDELGAGISASAVPTGGTASMVFVPPGRLAPPQREDDLLAQREWRDRLRVGSWWDFKRNGERVPMQLIWISQPPASCAFANRSATNKLEFTLAELSRQMQRGQAEPGREMEAPLIDRTERALFDETYRDLVHQTLHDPVTGLLNRKGFMHQLNQLAMPDQTDKGHAVGIIEFDQFRVIYNSCGGEAVEGLTRALAASVRTQLGADAILAAFRDDTFAFLLPNCRRADGCDKIDALLNQVKDFPFEHGPHRYSIGFNIGVTEYAPASFTPVDAVRHADSACITAKAMGRNRMQVYEESSLQLQTQESLIDWAGRLDAFLEGDGLHLRCQQVMPLEADSSLLPYYEILLGIETEAGLRIDPAHFIPSVERLQRAHEVDIWVIRNVFAWIHAHPEVFETVAGFAINLSATSLSSPEVMRYLQTALPESRFPTDKITFEITETAAIQSYGAAQDFIREIRRYGCKFSLDDFGSGFTSYAHLKNLRSDALKIDGSFVRDMLQNPDDLAMVRSMNDIGHSLGLRTVAEFAETPEIVDALREIGVDYAQGYAVHKPCRIEELVKMGSLA